VYGTNRAIELHHNSVSCEQQPESHPLRLSFEGIQDSYEKRSTRVIREDGVWVN